MKLPLFTRYALNTGVFFLPILFGWILDSTGGAGAGGGLWAILIGYAVALVTVLFVREHSAKKAKAYEQAA